MNLDDLKNIDLKNIDVKELVQKFKDSEYLKDKKFLTKFGIYFGSILLFLIIYYAFVNPKVQFQKERINIMLENEKQITALGENIVKLNNRIKEIQPEYDKKSKLFHSQKEVEEQKRYAAHYQERKERIEDKTASFNRQEGQEWPVTDCPLLREEHQGQLNREVRASHHAQLQAERREPGTAPGNVSHKNKRR